MEFKVEMKQDKETKNTVRFNAKKNDAPVSSVYVDKPKGTELGGEIVIQVTSK